LSTGSTSATNKNHYFNVLNGLPTVSTSETQFSVTFGHIYGSGSDTIGDSTTNRNTLKGSSRAVYNQLTNLLLEETEASGGFKISQGGSVLPTSITAGDPDRFVYALIGKRARFKDRLNKKSWTMTLSGSLSNGTTAKNLHLTDDSAYVPAVATPGGPRYNIVSGTLGVPTGSSPALAKDHKPYGWYYPEMGIMLFSGHQLSASIPGVHGNNLQVAFKSGSMLGFGIDETEGGKEDHNALRFVNCMKHMGDSTTLRLRSEEDQTQENYFCRIRAEEYNFSANPTFTSGSKNKIRNADMHGNPQTFITGVGLYNSSGQLLAIAKLSSPLKKNFASEATIKVKLTY
jgi:hypothetical protein